MGINFSTNRQEVEIYNQNKILKEQNNKLKNEIETLKYNLEKDRNNFKIAIEELEEKNKRKKKENMEEFYKKLDKSVDNYVNGMLKDEEINSIIPDYIEKRIYKNAFSLFIKIVKNVSETTSVKFLDQEITIDINPTIDSNNNLTNK